jgi:hypothetical protein
LRRIGGGGILTSRMSTRARRGAGLRIVLSFLWAFAVPNAWATPIGRADGHCSRHAEDPVPTPRHEHGGSHHDSGGAAWLAVPDPCQHCTQADGCQWPSGCTIAGAMLLPAPPSLAFVPTDRLREGWVPDHPLAANPTPPTPPPPSIL